MESMNKSKQPAIGKIMSKYNIMATNPNTELEVGVRFHAGNNAGGIGYIYKSMIDKLNEMSNSIEIIQHLDIYYQNNIRKTMVFVDGINQQKNIIIKKVLVEPPFIINRNIQNVKDIKAKLSNEIDGSEKDIKGNAELVKFKLRLRFSIKGDKLYTAELDLIKNAKPEDDLKNIKNSVFRKYNVDSIHNAIEFSIFDECRLEFEFDNSKVVNKIKTDGEGITVQDLFEPINMLAEYSNKNVNVEDYQKYIFSLARQIINNNKGLLESFRFKSGLKKLLNNVIEMDSNVYYKQIQPNMIKGSGYYITDKIDGKRTILMIKYDKEDKTNSNIVLLNDTITYLNKMKNTKQKELYYISLDCEMIKDDDGIHLFVFDVIVYNSLKYCNENFTKRLSVMKEAVLEVNNLIKSLDQKISVDCKEFILTDNNWKSQMDTFYKKSLTKKYEIDGLIFTPNDNSDYKKMVGYKWKPAEHSTIDFYVKKVDEEIVKTSPSLFTDAISKQKKNTNTDECDYYVLFSGISKKDLDSFKIKFMPNYERIIGEKININSNLIPIQFETSDGRYYVFRQNKGGNNIDGKIGEFGWNGTSWSLKRIRTDRDVELARGEYYGNYYKVAENIWYSINNPLTFQDLLEEKKAEDMYFMEDNVDIYKAQRGFNSYVKATAIETSIEQLRAESKKNPFVMDLAAGKGQDMPRLSSFGVKDAIFVDNDKSALMELIRRKHSLKNLNMKITTCHTDLNEDYTISIKNIEKSYGRSLKNELDMIICNFAFHYLAYDFNKIKNIIQLISYFMRENGIFVFTCFDGEKVKKQCGENGWDANSSEDIMGSKLKYSIRMVDDNKIKLILPFSKGEYYEENLLNIKNIQSFMKDNGFSVETIGSFSNMISSYKNKNLLSEDDKIFSGLYSYNVYRKNSNSALIIKKMPYSIISKELKNDEEEIQGSRELQSQYSENNSSVLENLPISNIIVVEQNMPNVAKLELEKHLIEYGYKNGNENSRLRKKVFYFQDETSINKVVEKKSKNSQLSVLIIHTDIINQVEKYLKYICKLPALNINISDKCYILNSESYIKFKNSSKNITEFFKDDAVKID